MATARVLTANAAFAQLLNMDIAQVPGLDVISVVASRDQAVVASVFSGVAAGSIQSCHGRAHVVLPGGELLDLFGWVRPLDLSDPGGPALLVLVPANGASRGPHPLVTDLTSSALCTLDHGARFTEISSDAGVLLGWDVGAYRGTPMQAAVHPEDASVLLLAFARSSAECRGTTINLRIRAHDGEWERVRCEISPLCDHVPPRFAVAISVPGRHLGTEPAHERASRLEGHLWRIGVELKAAGIADVPVMGELSWSDPVFRELSHRQVDILRRLARGQRVSSIAENLYLSQSTIRNHLVAIYRKLGVHSQSELLARLRGDMAN
jgi:DNA-binding CsgD family transcriptional regulator/PAS domain-containing protein